MSFSNKGCENKAGAKIMIANTVIRHLWLNVVLDILLLLEMGRKRANIILTEDSETFFFGTVHGYFINNSLSRAHKKAKSSALFLILFGRQVLNAAVSKGWKKIESWR